MADDTLQIKVDVDTKDADSKFDALATELGRIREATERTAPGFTSMEAGIVAGNAAAEIAIKGFQALAAAANFLFDNFNRGAEINDLSQSFETLSQKAGTTSDVLLNQLSKATLGTINNLDLMKIANQSMIAGLSPQALEDVAKAATTFADKTGTDAKQAMERFTFALTKGSDAQLRAIGLNIDNAKAIQDFAAKYGIAINQVSELGKAEAIREAALQKLRDTTASLGGVTQDTKDAYDSIGVAIQNQLDKVFQSIAANDDLRVAFNGIAQVIKEIDFTPLINGISSVIHLFTTLATDSIVAAEQALEDFERGIRVLSKVDLSNLATGVDVIARAKKDAEFEEIAAETDKIKTSMAGLAKVSDLVKGSLADTRAGVHLTAGDFAALQAELNKLPKSLDLDREGADKYNKANVQVRAELEQLRKTLPDVTDESGKLRGEWLNGKAAVDKLGDSMNKFFESLHDKTGANPVFNDLVTQIANLKVQEDAGVITNEQYADAVETLGRSFIHSKEDLDVFTQAYREGGAVAAGYEKIIQQTIETALKELDKLEQKTETLEQALQKGLVSGIGGFIDDLFKGDFAGALEGLGKTVGSSIGKNLGESLGKGIGGEFGGALGGQIGGALLGNLGGALADGVVSAFDHVFGGGHNAETEARKKVDAFLANVFDKNHLQIIINGQLEGLTDLDFGGSKGFNSGKFDDALLSAAGDIKGAFIGVGDAMNELLQTGQDLGGQLAAVFYNNVGGSLNNLQLLIQATGFSAQQMTDAITSSAKKGTLSFLEAQSAINGINKAMQKGIPDAVGASVQAFQNLLAAGSKGGQASIKALQDIGTEALELGKHTLPELQNLLVASGKFTNDQITKLFQDLAAHGIKSVDDLSKATDSTLISILSDLQAQGVLKEADKQAESLIDKISNIPKEKDITFNVRANYQNGADKVIQAATGGAPIRGESKLQ